MVAIRDVPNPIQWSEGMLLSPQHFQQEALRQQLTVAAHAGLANRFHWGVVHLLLDPVGSGMIRVRELEAAMPDGLFVSHDPTSPIPLEIDISAMGDRLSRAPITIHLTVPAPRSGTAGGTQRWISTQGHPVMDENGGEEIKVSRLYPRLALAASVLDSEAPSAQWVSMPIARLVFANDTFTMADYAPPTLIVTANSVIGRFVADAVRRLRERAMLLAEAQADSDVGEAVRAIVAALPRIEAQLAAEASHPFDLYLSFCDLVGSIAAVSKSGVPPRLSRFSHAEGLAAFSEISEYIDKTIARLGEVAAPLRFTFQEGMFGTEINEEWLKHPLIIGVLGPTAMSSADIVAWMENALIASRSQLERLSTLRVKGVERVVMDNDGRLGISPPRGMVLFSIEKDERLILPGERLEIWNPDNLGSRHRPVDIVLFRAR